MNFRYHVVSLVAVFLALAIGVIMGSTVIDQTLVDRLERQQEQLRIDIGEARDANTALEAQVGGLRESQSRLDAETGDRLVDDALAAVPVLALGFGDEEPETLDGVLELADAAGADLLGRLTFTDRLLAPDDAARTQLAAAIGEPSNRSADTLRTLAVDRVVSELRSAAAEAASGDAGPTTPVVEELLGAEFLTYAAPDGVEADAPVVEPGTRIVVMADDGVAEPGPELTIRLTEALVDTGGSAPPLAVVVVAAPAISDDGIRGDLDLIGQLRTDSPASARVSTVDNVDQLIGRVGAVLSLADAGKASTGHFGLGEGAASLLPPPVTATGG